MPPLETKNHRMESFETATHNFYTYLLIFTDIIGRHHDLIPSFLGSRIDMVSNLDPNSIIFTLSL